MINLPLTVIIPNRDRMSPSLKGTDFLFESLKRQTVNNFKILVMDGGSSNFSELKEWLISKQIPNLSILQKVMVGKFHKTLLNNTAIRLCDTEYIMTTDADMFFASKFFETLMKHLSPDMFIESRTMYWKPTTANLIYSGKLNPFDDLESCKIGRIKKRTTSGGCQCGHKSIWNKIRGYDERYMGWGSEDTDLTSRISKAGFQIRWLGESLESIMLFHQPHDKINPTQDMQDQYRNLTYLQNIKTHEANPEGWGGIKQ